MQFKGQINDYSVFVSIAHLPVSMANTHVIRRAFPMAITSVGTFRVYELSEGQSDEYKQQLQHDLMSIIIIAIDNVFLAAEFAF
jgi:hypothetical protein